MSTSAVDGVRLPGVEDLRDLATATAVGSAALSRGRLPHEREVDQRDQPGHNRPSAAAPRIGRVHLGGSLVRLARVLDDQPPDAAASPVEISATTTPTTEAVAASFSAGTM